MLVTFMITPSGQRLHTYRCKLEKLCPTCVIIECNLELHAGCQSPTSFTEASSSQVSVEKVHQDAISSFILRAHIKIFQIAPGKVSFHLQPERHELTHLALIQP
jgi:hypothetical protein